MDGGGDGAQSKLCQLQLLIMRIQQLYLENDMHSVLANQVS